MTLVMCISEIRSPGTNSTHPLRTNLFRGGELVLGSYSGGVSQVVGARAGISDDLASVLLKSGSTSPAITRA